MNKRSHISPERRERLSQGVYTISCIAEEYSCPDHGEGVCRRGFFSLFLQVAYGISSAKKLGIPYRIDFGNLTYSYSDPNSFEGNLNFWEYYFEGPPDQNVKPEVSNARFENYPLKIWDRGFIRCLHAQAMPDIILKPELRQELEDLKQQWKGLKILGVHVRKTDHHQEVAPAGDDKYFQLVEKKIAGFDKVFLATDDLDILREFETRFPDKVIYHPCFRVSGDQPLHTNASIDHPYELGRQAVLDCYSLSLCSSLILSPSNLSYAALLLNPDLPYHMAESTPAKRQRMKTLLLYYLDKWGIRKW